jgi:aminopeptidase-like protein
LYAADIGKQIFELAAEIFPICRSITGNGVRETLLHLNKHIDLKIHEVPTGTKVLDWTIPSEWTIHDAFIKDDQGKRIVDFRKSNLHVLNYSVPMHAKMPLRALKEHLFTLPDQPDVIPYRTSYYAEAWGFCLAHNQLLNMPDGIYEARIDSTLTDGHLTYGEFFCPGESEQEILLTAHICHPSLANDNCSGLALLTHLAKRLAARKTRYSYRFLFAPGTIGAIAWLARNEDKVSRIKHGLVVSCVGDGGGPSYKKSRRGDAPIDRAMAHVLKDASPSSTILDFSPYGYDERQYCSPGFNLPVGLFQRSQFGKFPEYHNSADDLAFIKPDNLGSSYRIITDALNILEADCWPLSTNPKGEPQLGRRGLYSSIGGERESPEHKMALLWIMNLADGRHSLLDIAERADIPFKVIANAVGLLRESGLLIPRDRETCVCDNQSGESRKARHEWSFSNPVAAMNGQPMKLE